MFLQASLETMFTPLSKRLLGFSSTENAITYVCIGFIAVVGYFRSLLFNSIIQFKIYFSVKYVNSRYEDRKLLFLGLTIELINTIVLRTGNNYILTTYTVYLHYVDLIIVCSKLF